VTVRAAVGDVELDYELVGSGPPLVWLHGLSGSLDESRPLCERLAKDFTVLSYSSRGHGRSTALTSRADYRYDKFADDLERMLDQVGFPHPVVAGGSHGANTALRHALKYPTRARALLLVAPGCNALRRPDLGRLALVRGSMRLAALRGEPHVIKAITGHDPRDPSLDEPALAAVAAARTHDYRSLLATMKLVPNQRVIAPSAVRTLSQPALVAAWPKDPILHPIAVARRIAALMPSAEFVEIDRPEALGPDRAAELMAGWAADLLARSQ
jgi:pimeloyl-ACP methyl ester carboxylesterase